MADAAPAGPAAPTPAGAAPQAGNQLAANGKPAAPTPAPKYKFDFGDGEKEYTADVLRAEVTRGRKANQTLSLAEKRAQEAARKEQEAETRLAALKSGDMGKVRAALKDLGIPERDLANFIGKDLLEEMELTPEQKRIRELERQAREREEVEGKRKQQEQSAKEKAEEERHVNELSELFTTVMERAGLPKESAAAVFPRLANLYAAVEGSGGQVDPDLAAERIKATLTAEHRALYWRKGDDGKEALNVEALKSMLGPEAFTELRQQAVAEYRARKSESGAPSMPQTPTQQRQEPQGQQSPSKGNFWRQLEKAYR